MADQFGAVPYKWPTFPSFITSLTAGQRYFRRQMRAIPEEFIQGFFLNCLSFNQNPCNTIIQFKYRINHVKIFQKIRFNRKIKNIRKWRKFPFLFSFLYLFLFWKFLLFYLYNILILFVTWKEATYFWLNNYPIILNKEG